MERLKGIGNLITPPPEVSSPLPTSGHENGTPVLPFNTSYLLIEQYYLGLGLEIIWL
jgi:hypothetical protein